MEVFPIKTGPETPARFAQRFDDVHEGTDIFAPAGAQVLAVADGRVRHATEPKGGKVVYLQESNGTRYYYAHLAAWADPLKPGKTKSVEAGDLIGYVGDTGNAKGSPPHVHFEYRPKGGEKADPFPVLSSLVVEHGGPIVPPKRPKNKNSPKRKRTKKKSQSESFVGFALLVGIGYAISRGRK